MRISDESYERVADILDDIASACDTADYYEDWEDMASPSFYAMDDLDADQYDMTCAAMKEKISDLYAEGRENYANGIRAAFYRYLVERRGYLDNIGFAWEPDEPDEDADEYELEEYNEEMERYRENKAYADVVDKWVGIIGRIAVRES